MTLAQWLDKWYTVYKLPKLKPTTLATIRICIDKHIPLDLKQCNLRDLTPLDIEEALLKVPSSRMRESTYNVYNDCLNRAYKLGFMSVKIMDCVDSVKHVRKQGQALTLQEQRKFISAVSHNKPLSRFYTFILLTGCRRSEALSVRWSDIDLDAQTLVIRGTKTAGSFRTIPLFPQVAELLKTVPRDSDHPLMVFTYYPRYVTRAFHKYCPEHTLHDLRHTFATRCLELGISLRVVQQWLGHTRIDTTASIYSHVLDDFQKQEAKKFVLDIPLAI